MNTAKEEKKRKRTPRIFYRERLRLSQIDLSSGNSNREKAPKEPQVMVITIRRNGQLRALRRDAETRRPFNLLFN